MTQLSVLELLALFNFSEVIQSQRLAEFSYRFGGIVGHIEIGLIPDNAVMATVVGIVSGSLIAASIIASTKWGRDKVRYKLRGEFYLGDDPSWSETHGGTCQNFWVQILADMGMPEGALGNPDPQKLEGRFFGLSEKRVLRSREAKDIIKAIYSNPDCPKIRIAWQLCAGNNPAGNMNACVLEKQPGEQAPSKQLYKKLPELAEQQQQAASGG